MHKLTTTGLTVLGISAVVGLLCFGIYFQWQSSIGNRFSALLSNSVPPHISLCMVGFVLVGPLGALVGIILAFVGAAKGSHIPNESSNRSLLSSNNRESSEAVILCKGCSAVFSADNKGRRCDHCGAILR